ncbi:MAG: hypothetical protein H8E55_01670 [Pelagibacterales bacterium]|nr:hypothetical protein [Pelagibacterales bacterium]
MQKYKAIIKVTRLYEITFDSSDPKQAAVDAETITSNESLGSGSHIDEQIEIKEITEDKTDSNLPNAFRHVWERKDKY